MRAVDHERQAAQQRVNSARNEASMREQQLESARLELQKEREGLFERIARGDGVPELPESVAGAATREVEPVQSSASGTDRPTSPPPAYTDAANTGTAQSDEWWK